MANLVSKLFFPLILSLYIICVLPTYLSDLCPSLVELVLSCNNLSGNVPESFGACSILELFGISNDKFSGQLPVDSLVKMSNLKNLSLLFNNFIGSLFESLSKMVSLETLDMSSNNLSRVISSRICQDSRNNLKVLYLQNNLLTGSIPESLSNCSKLESLDLSCNYLTLYGEIPQELMYLQRLENLILDFNDLNGSTLANLSNCTNLNWISLSNN
ncbi:unnamed protein product [Coffea canephora]|uniref:Leucine-rich repeat-containing N-terminal plant-type domain-containing protein n=1 Tax=Coffea canephora TaxID=49390 RepID=A0A068UA98_COFCA|nr:unnamed protein product [Coffea canephora]